MQQGSPAGVESPTARFPREEIANSLTHGLGLVLSLVGAAVLLIGALRHGDALVIGGCAVYAAALIAVYLFSTLSHVFHRPPHRHLFRRLDQGFIFLFIAGSYTPLALAYLRSGWWWVLFGTIWGIAFCGFISKVVLKHRIDAVSAVFYLLLGWLPIIAARSMFGLIPMGGLVWMGIGGLCYTLGVVFLTLDTKVPFFHAVWHMMVIGGSACHYAAILLYVGLRGH